MCKFVVGIVALGVGLAPLAVLAQDRERDYEDVLRLVEEAKREMNKVEKAGKTMRARVLAVEAPQDPDRGPNDLSREVRKLRAEVQELREMIEGLRGEGRKPERKRNEDREPKALVMRAFNRAIESRRDGRDEFGGGRFELPFDREGGPGAFAFRFEGEGGCDCEGCPMSRKGMKNFKPRRDDERPRYENRRSEKRPREFMRGEGEDEMMYLWTQEGERRPRVKILRGNPRQMELEIEECEDCPCPKDSCEGEDCERCPHPKRGGDGCCEDEDEDEDDDEDEEDDEEGEDEDDLLNRLFQYFDATY